MQLSLATDSGETVLSSGPVLAVYRISSVGRRQTGVIADVLVDAASGGGLRGHEQTTAGGEKALLADLDAIEAITGPAVLAHRPAPAFSGAVSRLGSRAPSAKWLSPDSARHDVWLVEGEQLDWLQRACAQLDPLYIIDGHHRIAAAAARAETRRPRGSAAIAASPAATLLAAVFPTDELDVHAYHRIVDLSAGPSWEHLLDQLSRRFDVTPADDLEAARPQAPSEFGLGLAGGWHRLRARPPAAAARAQGQTDVELLQELVLAPLLGISDPRSDDRIAFVPDVDESQTLIEAARRPDRACFLVHPLTMDDVLAVADAGRALPPKSTWFDPKPISGAIAPAERLALGTAESAAPR